MSALHRKGKPSESLELSREDVDTFFSIVSFHLHTSPAS
jgi:hypothetical protein